jgi:hypothetical protein
MLFPANSRSRRAGRTRRGGRSGPVLSLVRAVGVQTSGHMAGPGVGASGPGGARAGASNLEKDLKDLERLLKADASNGAGDGGADASSVKQQLRSVLRKLMEAYFTPLNGALAAPPRRDLTTPRPATPRSAQTRDAVPPRPAQGRAPASRRGVHGQQRVLRARVRPPRPARLVRGPEVRPRAPSSRRSHETQSRHPPPAPVAGARSRARAGDRSRRLARLPAQPFPRRRDHRRVSTPRS